MEQMPGAVASTEQLGLPPHHTQLMDGTLVYTADQMRAHAAEKVAAERERCARICDGIGATYSGESRRLEGQRATHAAGRRDGAHVCAATIRKA